MKTPREILLARHRGMESKLDAVRQRALAEGCAKQRPATVQARMIQSARELFRIPRVAWAGLAAAWLVIFGLNLASRETTGQPARVVLARPSTETLQALREQKRLFAELVEAASAYDADAPRFVPRPRSQQKTQFGFA